MHHWLVDKCVRRNETSLFISKLILCFFLILQKRRDVSCPWLVSWTINFLSLIMYFLYDPISVHSGIMFKEGKPLCIWDLQCKKYTTMLLYVLEKYLHLQMCGFGMFQKSLTLIFFMHPWIS